MTLEDKIAEIVKEAMETGHIHEIAVGTGLLNSEILKDDIVEYTKQILQEIFQGIYVECPECTQKINDKISRFFRENCSTCKGTGKVQAIPDVKGMVELIHLQEKYIKLLGDEINELAGFASTHYWVSTRYKKGKKLREEIQALTTPQGKLYL